MRKVVALLAGLLALLAPTAWACDCAPTSPGEAARSHDIVAHVRIERVELAQDDHLIYYTMHPLQVWKGEFDSSFLVATADDPASCGMPDLRVRSELMVYLQAPDAQGRYSLESCSGTTAYTPQEEQAVTEALGPGVAPSLDPRYPPGEIKIDGIEPSFPTAVLVGGALLVILGAVLGGIFGQLRRNRR